NVPTKVTNLTTNAVSIKIRIFPAKRFKKDKSIKKKDNYVLELETSDTITKLVREFFRACLAIGNTGELMNYLTDELVIALSTWERVSLILSILGGLITDSPTTFGMLLSLGGDITQSESTLQPVIQITIPQIFKYLNDSISSSEEARLIANSSP
ncbi:4967_t:CDS:2, partial [Acaulospora morrowiae]